MQTNGLSEYVLGDRLHAGGGREAKSPQGFLEWLDNLPGEGELIRT